MKILVVGQQGMLAQELRESFRAAGIVAVCKGRPELDICDPKTIENVLLQEIPSLVINAAANTDVEKAESQPNAASAVNRDGAKTLAEFCQRRNIPLVHISTDYVFDGTARRPYREDDPALPLGMYARSKWEGEEAVRQSQPQHIILRTAWLYSIYGRNFLKTVVRKAMEGQELRIVHDQWGCPTWTKDVASALVVMAQKISQAPTVAWGTYHFCGAGEATWYEFAQAIIEQANTFSLVPETSLTPISSEEFCSAVKRPAYSVLDCSKIQHTFGIIPSTWKASVHQCVKELFACPDLLRAPS